MIAVSNGQGEAVSWLLEHGANAEILDLQGKTAMMLAAERGDEDTIGLLKLAANRAADR